MKRILLISFFILLAAACTPMEEKRDALMSEAREAEHSGHCDTASKAALGALELDPALPEAHLILGRCDMENGKRREAAGRYEKALELLPDSTEAFIALSRIALLENEAEKAADYAQRAWEKGDRSRELLLLRAGVLMAKQDFTAAIPLFEEIVAADPDDEESLIGLASAYINTNERGKARALLASSLGRHPRSPAILSLLLNLSRMDEDWAAADDYLQRLRDLNPASEDLALQRADILSLSGKGGEIEDFLNAFLKDNPEAAKVRLALVNMASSRRDFDKALEILAEAPEEKATLKLATATILAAAGRVDECITLFKEVAAGSEAPQAAEAHMALAEIYTQRNMQAEAARELDAVIAAFPDNQAARLMRGRVRLGLGEHTGAVGDFESVIAAHPENYVAVLALAEAYLTSGDAGMAENLVAGVIQRAPKFVQAYMLLGNVYLARQMPDAALLTLRIGQAAAPGDANLLFAEADLLVKLERYKEAAAVFEKLSKSKDEEAVATALFRLGGVYGAAKDHIKAADAYGRLLALDPDSPVAAEGHSRALITAKKEKAALVFAEKRQKQRPDDPAAAMLLGEAALASKDVKKAEKAYLRAVELAPHWDKPLMTMSQIYMATKRGDEAVKLCRDSMTKAPDSPQPAMTLARVYEQRNELKAAEETYRNILVKHPDVLPAANSLALLLTRYKPDDERLNEAEQLAKKATASGSPATFDTLGWVQHLRGSHAEGEANLRKARSAMPDNPFVAYHLAAALAAQDDADKKEEAGKLVAEALKTKNFPYKKEAEKLQQLLSKK